MTFFSNLIDHGFRDFEETILQTAIAGASTYIGMQAGAMVAASLALPGLGTILGAIFGSLLGSFFSWLFGGRKLPPPPELVHLETNADGTQTLYVTSHAHGYGILARPEFDDTLIGGAYDDTLIGGTGDNEIFAKGGKETGEKRGFLVGFLGGDFLRTGEYFKVFEARKESHDDKRRQKDRFATVSFSSFPLF